MMNSIAVLLKKLTLNFLTAEKPYYKGFSGIVKC
jgi:hypothetical protein